MRVTTAFNKILAIPGGENVPQAVEGPDQRAEVVSGPAGAGGGGIEDVAKVVGAAGLNETPTLA